MHPDICGIILKVSYPSMGDTSRIEVLDKTMQDWVALSLGDSFVAAVDFSGEVTLPVLIKPYIKKSDYTVVLFSDTPLITRKTVLDAVFDLERSRENVLKMTRGYVFKTAFLMNADKIYASNHRFFEEEDFLTAFSFKQTAMVADVLRNRILSYHMQSGVQFDDPASTFIGCDAVIEKGVKIGPFNIIKGKTVIKSGTKIVRGCTIDSSVLDEGCVIQDSVIEKSYIGKYATVGPFAHVRNLAKVGEGCRVGNFTEIKNSVVGDGTKIAHLSYVGDAALGTSCNIGCGTVFCNYDGKNKHHTQLGDKVFVGSNSNLVAPLTVGDNAFIAAGSTITKDVPADSLAIARERQTIKKDWKKEE